MQVTTLVLGGFLLFHSDSVGDRPSVLAYTGHLPGDLDPPSIALDREVTVLDLLSHNGLGELPHYGELVSKVLVEGFEIARERDVRFAVTIGGDRATIDIQHVGRLDEGVAQAFVPRVERVVDFETTSRFAEKPVTRTLPRKTPAKPFGFSPMIPPALELVDLESPRTPPFLPSPCTPIPLKLKPSTPLPRTLSPNVPAPG